MTTLVNCTPFAATTFAVLDPSACQFDVVVVSATYEAQPGQDCCLADEQVPVKEADEFHGEPGGSSVRWEGEIALEKPFVDVLLQGHAVVPHGGRAESLHVALSVGSWRKTLRVSGDRFWRQAVLGAVASSPRPFERMPLIYERAFGGVTPQGSDARNPLGVGFRRARSVDPGIDTELPNIEYPSQAMEGPRDEPEPACFGVVSRFARTRAVFAGTYDEAWKSHRWPLLPLDFDNRYFQAAPADQQLPDLSAGQRVDVEHMTPQGMWSFELPALDLPLRLWPDDGIERRLRVDTLVIQPDTHRFTLIARAKVPILRNRRPVEEYFLGPVSPGWWRARSQGKQYFSWAAARGERLRAGVVQP